MRGWNWLVAAVLVLLSSLSRGLAQPGAPDAAASGTLTIGDPAPKLKISQWLKGEPIERFSTGRVYAVEFWATWCGPCIAGIPHLSELQERFREHADFVGVTRFDETNTLEAVEAFVAQRGDSMSYRVAFDAMGETWMAYMDAAGQGGIPCAFIVDKQARIAWIGHPADPAFEETLAEIIADRFDLEAAKRADAERAAKGQKLAELQRQLHAAWQSGEHERALALADEVVASDPESMVRWAWWKFEALMVGLERPEEAHAYARRLRDGPYSEDPEMLMRLAYGIADSLGLESPDLDLALDLAERSVELTSEQDAYKLAGLAMVHARRKEFDAGIAALQRAVDIAPTPAMRHYMENELEFMKMDKEMSEEGDR